jgi:hypothetical protein
MLHHPTAQLQTALMAFLFLVMATLLTMLLARPVHGGF